MDRIAQTSRTPSDEMLEEAWKEFARELDSCSTIPLSTSFQGAPQDRAAGYRLLARSISLGLQHKLENCDPLNPELMHTYDPIRKQFGDNADAYYVCAPINGTETYRIHGHRGTARFFAVSLIESAPTPYGGNTAVVKFAHQLEVAPNGTFEIIISPQPHSGNWLHSTPTVFRVVIRQFFADWENEIPMQARIDRLGGPSVEAFTADGFARSLVNAAKWVGQSCRYTLDSIEKWRARPNEFLSFRQLDDKLSNTPGGEAMIAYWELPRDEALIIRVYPPRAHFWAVEFGNFWFETMDYRTRLCGTNCHYARLEHDGELIVVVSHDDPGHPNWLDTAAFVAGYLCVRWMIADAYPAPSCTQVKRSKLLSHLPTFTPVTAEERVEQIAARRRGAIKRFGY